MVRKNSDIDLIDKRIGRKIYESRLERGMTRHELGDKIAVTHQQCQKYERGINRVSAGRLMLIAKVLNKPVKYFYEDIVQINTLETKSDDQRVCMEVSKNFMMIKNSVYQDAINTLVKTLAKEVS